MFQTINEISIHPELYNQKKVLIQGWITNIRGNLKIIFVELNDGSSFKNLQCVLKKEFIDFDKIENLALGVAVEISGIFSNTPERQQFGEVLVETLEIKGNNYNTNFPIQNQEISLEVLRQMPHFRHRSRLFRVIMKLRSALFFEIHKFFRRQGFINFSAPILTSNDGEGAGEVFIVDDENKDFFNKKTTLGVTGQLHAEAYALGFKKVYTFAPTFRAERSNTRRHAAEFWMIEPEVAFFTLEQIIELAVKLLQKVIKSVIIRNKDEFIFLEKAGDKNLRKRLLQFCDSQVTQISYEKAIELLLEHQEKFEEKDLFFGCDLKTEHERFLTEEIFHMPVVIINYPKNLKAFYMHQNEDGQTVAAFDLLVPGIGELIGGSQREVRYEKLLARMNELNMNIEEFQWYLDLRKYGNPGSSGFGLGFERLLMYITGIENIRDVIPFPRTNKNILM
ncbi:asparagine--tRNA ligase [Mesomycoplasma hyopneumoniae]|uniref:Asparagine--tRNA ligase n=1 Tax=Mesomycoplasma hyopneumoniae (strain 232) TaxID=295358 RepID=SYN_MESH2|nr:asparagine--tRNA ligase [Mesomycoplasma hyopneumoniae]Q600N9.1 RecName: Full=Asparagine--tRNA ligase; AltName: Full=Asparaginyl-tRNA synthetase; Short=AsnRS [Mesomycoplasma hyopneumoniae 232]AAV27566.1 asparagine--tRNA synthetase [Mesomycoplasma hyopneumoniae 232]OWG14015.1 asparagine--tRNA ligase [Mesomycoplasma hyopneumoniae]UIF66820.1 asparagine--tRNA ligase [Mesomycoplasma hyopneumoniae]VEU65391.1 lysyl-tRNA synthetase [Mesomycoplasma hyopneumoniae]